MVIKKKKVTKDGGAGRWAGGGGDTLQWRSESATRTVSDDGFVVMYAARRVYVVTRRCCGGGGCRVRERCGTTAGDNKRQPRGQRPTDKDRAALAVGRLVCRRGDGGGRDNNVAPARGRGGAAYGASTASTYNRPARHPTPQQSVPSHPAAISLRKGTRRVPCRPHESATFLRRTQPQTFRRDEWTLLRPSPPTLGTSKTRSPPPDYRARFDVSSTKAINAILRHLRHVIVFALNTTGPNFFSPDKSDGQ